MHCPGYMVIADFPFCRRAESGEPMLAEQKVNFCRQFGFASDRLFSKDHLIPEILSNVARRLSLTWNLPKPWCGASWALRRLKAWALRRCQPSKFRLLWAKVER